MNQKKPILPKEIKESIPVECRIVTKDSEVYLYQTFETKKGATFGKFSPLKNQNKIINYKDFEKFDSSHCTLQ